MLLIVHAAIFSSGNVLASLSTCNLFYSHMFDEKFTLKEIVRHEL